MLVHSLPSPPYFTRRNLPPASPLVGWWCVRWSVSDPSVGQTCFLVIRSISHWHQARQRVVGRILFNCVILLVFLIFLSVPLSPHLPHSAFLLADAEETLAPPPSYVVSFVHFHERGLAFPLHTFDVTLFIICRCNFIT